MLSQALILGQMLKYLELTEEIIQKECKDLENGVPRKFSKSK